VNVAIFSAKKYDREFLNAANGSVHKLRFFEPHLNEETAGLATGFEAVCVFVNDHVDAAVSKCDHHRPPGFLHARSLVEHRGHNHEQHHQVREQPAARKAGRLILICPSSSDEWKFSGFCFAKI